MGCCFGLVWSLLYMKFRGILKSRGFTAVVSPQLSSVAALAESNTQSDILACAPGSMWWLECCYPDRQFHYPEMANSSSTSMFVFLLLLLVGDFVVVVVVFLVLFFILVCCFPNA